MISFSGAFVGDSVWGSACVENETIYRHRRRNYCSTYVIFNILFTTLKKIKGNKRKYF